LLVDTEDSKENLSHNKIGNFLISQKYQIYVDPLTNVGHSANQTDSMRWEGL